MKVNYIYCDNRVNEGHPIGYYLTFNEMWFTGELSELFLGHNGTNKFLEISKQCNCNFYKYIEGAIDSVVFQNEEDALRAAIMLNLIL